MTLRRNLWYLFPDLFQPEIMLRSHYMFYGDRHAYYMNYGNNDPLW